MLGKWTDTIDSLSEKYISAVPYEHLVINNFFDEGYAEELVKNTPDPDDTWFKYDNPFEGKYLFNNFKEGDAVKKAIDYLYEPDFIKLMSKLTGVNNLESDPSLNAGGLHAYPRNGISGIHLDYTIHPTLNKERRVSIIVYLSKGWKPEWGGQLNIWDRQLTKKTTIEHDLWNTAIIFKTNGPTYHGVAEPLKCPEGTYRKSIGIYYLTEPTAESLVNPRYHAVYFPTPGAEVSDKLKKLYEIRKERRITEDDMSDWPTWRQDCGRTG